MGGDRDNVAAFRAARLRGALTPRCTAGDLKLPADVSRRRRAEIRMCQ